MEEDSKSSTDTEEGLLNFLIVKKAMRPKLENFPNINEIYEECWEGERENQFRV